MTLLISLIVGAIIARAGLAISKYYGILDDPRRAKVYNRPRIPTIQGVTLFLAFLMILGGSLRYFEYNDYLLYLVVGAGSLVLMSTIEVYVKISALIRLLIQFAVVWLIIRYGGLYTELIQFGSLKLELGKILGTLVSFVWFILCINAINMFDGIEGQTSGVSAIGYTTIWAVLTYIVMPHFPNISAENLIVLETVQHASIILAVLAWIYTYLESSNKCLLRDAWTYFYGFTLAYLSLLWWAKIGTLVVVFSLVIFDAIWVIFWRIFMMKKHPFKGDLTHVHHRLLVLKRSRGEVRAFVLIWSASMAVLMLLQGTNSTNKRIIFLMMAVIFYGINVYLYLIKKKNPEYKLDDRVKEILNDSTYNDKN